MKILIGMIDDIDKSDEVYHEKLLNLTDFWLFNMKRAFKGSSHELVVHHFSSENQALEYSVKENYDYCIGNWIGNLLKPGVAGGINVILDAIDQCERAGGLAGHINLFKDRLPYFYKSFWCVNVEKYKNFGQPKWESHSEKAFPAFSASLENIHDHYTPLWLRPTEGLFSNKIYQINWGTGLIEAWLRNGAEIVNFSPENRRLRNHLYPEHKDQLKLYFDSKISPLDLKIAEQKRYFRTTDYELSRDKVFLFNTDPINLKIENVTIDCFVGVAAGFRPQKLLFKAGVHRNTKIKYVDHSEMTLNFRRWLVDHWDGRYIQQAMSGFEKFVGREVYWLHSLQESIQTSHEKLISTFGGFDQWLNFWQDYRKLPHEYIQMDLVRDVDGFADLAAESGINYFYFSNCFNTEAALVKWGKSALKSKFKILLERLKDKSVIFDGTDVDHHYPPPNWLEEVKKEYSL